MILLLKLLCAHFIADFLMQPDEWIKDKNKNNFSSIKLRWHMLVHLSLYAIFLSLDTKFWVGVVLIIVSHYLIDASKAYIIGRMENKARHGLGLFIVDQALHVMVIVAVVNYYQPLEWVHAFVIKEHVWLLFLAVILLTVVSSIFIKVVMSCMNLEISQGNTDMNGGRYIGILERLFTFAFVVTGNLQAVGFLIAAKSVFRFGDLNKDNNRDMTEYVLIGTLISFGLALLIAGGYKYTLALL